MSPFSRSRLAFDHYLIHPSDSPSTLTTEVFVKDGIGIRRLESGHCIREDEWTQFAHINQVRSTEVVQAWRPSDVWAGLGFILHA